MRFSSFFSQNADFSIVFSYFCILNQPAKCYLHLVFRQSTLSIDKTKNLWIQRN